MNKEPRIGLVTTTIHVPTVLELLHAHDPSVAFFVAGDLKTPPAAEEFVMTKCGPNAYYFTPEHQKKLGYACSELIGWNCIQRRNIATLEALKWKADIIVFHDDDNFPMNESYFDDFVSILHHPFNGIAVSGYGDWFDVGQMLDPVAPHRGFPLDKIALWRASTVVGAKVGVAAGICMGDPDIDAITRIANRAKYLDVHHHSQLLDAGIVVRPTTRTVYNSQNSAFIRELAPAMFMMPGIGRYDDIWASLICQRVMRERNLHVHFGRPYAWQSRNPHNLVSDLKAEIFGMEHTVRFAEVLDNTPLYGGSVAHDVKTLAQALAVTTWFPIPSVLALRAWLEDIETVMK